MTNTQPIVTPISPQTIGDTLYYLLTTKDPYNKYTKTYEVGSKDVPKVIEYIKEVYSKYLGLKLELLFKDAVSNIQPGDIIRVDDRVYIITQTQGLELPITWPSLSKDDYNKLNINNFRSYFVTRPDYASTKTLLSNLRAVAKEIISSDSKTNRLLNQTSQVLLNADKDRIYEELGEGVLQIGDLIFLVDPTQVAFNTQNGYQYFPTLRTQGNPKIPTIEQVKNLSINLIFPNEDSINYQLLNLYAMFKRTPFVNIRNKDISTFFEDICFQKEWLSVALESIQVQSVNGFPNTVQATITLLPFDYKMISDGFQALKSLQDVERQQAILYKNNTLDNLIRKSESKLHEQSILPERFVDILTNDIQKSPDFRNSLPFRAFYQSMIAERKYISNNYGEPVPVEGFDAFDISRFRPTKPEMLLHNYSAQDNQQPVEFEYSYIPDDFRGISKKISDSRLQGQADILSGLFSLYDSIKKPEDIFRSMVTLFTNEKDFFNITEAKFHKIDNMMDTIMARYNITINKEPNERHPIKTLYDLIWQGINVKLGTRGVAETFRDIQSIIAGNITPDSTDILGFLNGVQFYDNTTNGIGTFQWGIKKIWEWINIGNVEQNKKNFSAFIIDMNQIIQQELGLIDSNKMLIVNPQNSEDMFSVFQLPIEKAKIIIDNKNDVITGWSLIFANKFIPINIQAFKYPYYQHLGSEDAILSLSITSISKETNFKAQLSRLSERLYETTKIVTLTAPELITYLDSRLTINAPIGHIFRAFGIQKVVFDNSNSVTVDGQPNCWITNVGFTQSNFTIAQYHDVSSIPSNDLARIEIAKLVSYIEKDNDNFKIIKYRNKDTKEILNLSLNEIIRFKFLKKHGADLESYINQTKQLSGSTLTEQVAGSSLSTTSPGRVDVSRVAGVSVSTQSTQFKDPLVGMRAATKILNDMKEFLKVEEITDSATIELNNILLEYPQFKKILNFLTSRVDDLLDQQLASFKQIIMANTGIIDTFHNNLRKQFGNDVVVGMGAGMLIAFFLFNPVGLGLAGAAGLATLALGGSIFVEGVLKAGLETGQEEIKKFLISKFDKIFMDLEDSISTSITIEFADKIIRDPIIYRKIITPKIIGVTNFNNIERLKNTSFVNCYNDFDLPTISDNFFIGPDFYLYNNIINTSETRTYILEATKRYAKVGKLTSMMTLVESTEILKRYDQILDQVENVDPVIKESLNNIMLEDLPKDQTSDLKNLIVQLQNAQDRLSLYTNSLSDTISEIKSHELLKEFERLYKDKLPTSEFNAAYDLLSARLGNSQANVLNNLDFVKLNLIKTARMKTMLEIFNVYSTINSYMLENQTSIIQDIGNQNSRTKEFKDLIVGTKSKAERDSAIKLNDSLEFFLKNAQTLTTKTLESNTFGKELDALIKGIKKQFDKGVAQSTNENSISLPGILRIENFLFNKIGYYIRLNTFLQDYQSYGGDNAVARIDFSNLPELRFLDFWNFRAVEENQRKINILRNFEESQDPKKDTTLKMYPTFKLFFVEEDKNFITHNFDDYYTHNAIQSIEIISNKNSPSTTAVIRLSNVTNSLTDKMSLMRESEELYGYSLGNKKAENLFFGTLDVKPGTQIIIKMGYAPFDNLLTTVFQGRIIEMNNGPMVEMVCQSYSAQLNHQIVAEKFGVLSTVKDYGDIASATLDMIPGLEKLGKISTLGLSNSNDFTGRNIRNIRGKFGDRFLMSNLIGNLSSMIYAQDNPRDENIYLNYSTANTIYHHPTFDWVIYDQSVWNVLKEICLYNRNTITTVRPFNNDPLSTNNDLRETLIVGDKAGYYKFNDSFSLSTLNIKEVDRAVAAFNTLKDIIPKITDRGFFTPTSPDANTAFYIDSYLSSKESVARPDKTKLTTLAKPVYMFLQNQLYALVLVSYLIKNNQNAPGGITFLDALNNLIVNNKIIDGLKKDPFSELLYNLVTFSKMAPINESSLSLIDFSEDEILSSKRTLFTKICSALKNPELGINRIEMNAEEYYNVKAIISNADEKLSDNPQYRKIQQHYLVTDLSDIISNNISLNSNFANVVNVYYTNEPKIKTASLDRLDDDYIRKHLNIWSVKAFGDQRDEFSRPLNSYQKNIDTNWFDTTNKTKKFFESYSRVKMSEQKLFNLSEDDLNIPRWDLFPSFVVVGVRLLQKEIEKMYQGTIEIVGNPNIKPYDVLHIQDYTNDMHGAVEVEEVIHTFTPDRGFRTTITPNLITFDRDPIQLQDIQVINQIYDFANERRVISTGINAAGAVASIALGSLGGPIGLAIGAGAAIFPAFNGTVGSYMKHHRFLYDQLGHILGRDCINFTSLLYHGMPFMAGFDGIDYTNLKTLMNHSVADVKNPITRYLAFSDTLVANISTGWDPDKLGIMGRYLSRYSADVGAQPLNLKAGIVE